MEQNASFLVDLNKLEDIDDIKSDDCGHWIHKGTKTTKAIVWLNKGKVTRAVSVDNK